MMRLIYIAFIATVNSDWISQYRRYVLHDVLMTHSEHEAYCVSQYNTHLASIHCATEENELINLIQEKYPNSNKKAFIGLMKNDSQWIDGTTVTFQGNVDISGDGDCMEMLIDTITKWNDLPCSFLRFGFCNYGNLDTITNCESIIPQSLYILHQVSATWHGSESLCLFNYGSNLASIHSTTDEIAAITETNNNEAFIGLNDISVEDVWRWSDGSVWDYGTTYFTVPWASTQPDNYLSYEHCAHITIDNAWNDAPCNYTKYALCGYPQPIQIINDPSNYMRIPSVNNIIGVIDVLDEIHIEFDIIFTSWPEASSYGSILQIGNLGTERFPAIYIHGAQFFHSSFSTIVTHNEKHDSNTIGTLNLGVLYHYVLHQTQDSVYLTVNGETVYNGYIDSHSIIKDRNLYLGNSWKSDVDNLFSATITNLFISTSNSYINPFNYNCDATNRWTIMSGSWVFDNTTCTITQTDVNWTGVVWLGTADPSSIQWTDYNVEIRFRFLSTAHTVGLLMRAQNVSAVNDGGQQYQFAASYSNQKIEFSIKDNDHIAVSGKPTLIVVNTDYILRVEAIGNKFDIYWNNEFFFTVNQSDYSFGSVGLRTYKSDAIFTSVRIIFPSDNYLYTVSPTYQPTTQPTILPSTVPTIQPTIYPTFIPTSVPSVHPTASTTHPTFNPTSSTIYPTIHPTFIPTIYPTLIPTIYPSLIPTLNPITSEPTPSPTNINEGNVEEKSTALLEIGNGNTNSGSEGDKKISSDILTGNSLMIILVSVVILLLLIVCCICFCIVFRNKKNEQHLETTNVEMHKTLSVGSNSAISSETVPIDKIDDNEIKSKQDVTITPFLFTPQNPLATNVITADLNTDIGYDKPLPASSLDLLNTDDNEMENEEDDESEHLYEQGTETTIGGIDTAQ